jgi:hypothetical protein
LRRMSAARARKYGHVKSITYVFDFTIEPVGFNGTGCFSTAC